jgi:CHAD domain-containing protein
LHRARLWRRARRKLLPLARQPWRKVCFRKSAPAKAGKLRRKFFKESARIREGLHLEAARFHELDAAGLHEFRRALRRLRYLRELALSRREQRSERVLRRLVAFQESLGEMQNCAIVRAFFASQTGFKPGGKVARLALLQERQWFRQARGHLTRFLPQRHRV